MSILCDPSSVGIGSYLPSEVVTNADLAKIVETSDEWIVERTGIRQRHRAAEGEFTSHLATKAARAALEDAGLGPQDIDLVVVATATPDHTFPASATQVQAALGITQRLRLRPPGGLLRLRLRAGHRRRADQGRPRPPRAGDRRRDLLAHPRLDRPHHLRAVRRRRRRRRARGPAQSAGTNDDRGLIAAHLRADGRHCDKLYVDGGPSTTKHRRPPPHGGQGGLQARRRP